VAAGTAYGTAFSFFLGRRYGGRFYAQLVAARQEQQQGQAQCRAGTACEKRKVGLHRRIFGDS
jgi:hypothetical protein